ncbi:MAG: DUF5615 family PIN-like protein [Planctomycetes bacterium]|nr:DUF5615 family PIN-like protein [Planctomycetota bacterium]
MDAPIVEQLRSDGHELIYVAELDPGVPDDVVLNRANAEGRLLLTADKDFGELVFRIGRVTGGVILIRLAGLSTRAKSAIVSRAILERGSEMLGAFSVISAGSVRIRAPR